MNVLDKNLLGSQQKFLATVHPCIALNAKSSTICIHMYITQDLNAISDSMSSSQASRKCTIDMVLMGECGEIGSFVKDC